MRLNPRGGIMDVVAEPLSKKAGWRGGSFSVEGVSVSSEAQEKNKALVRRFLEAQSKGEVDTVKEMLAPHFVQHDLPQEESDHRERYLRVLAEEQAAFSDIRYIIEDQIAEGDKVMTRWRGRGVHDRGEYTGLAPTGRESEAKIIDVHRVEGGKIADEWKGTTAIENVQEERLAQVERERELLEQELRVARSIQQASLPKEVPTLEGWQISPFYQPAREVGGDFYDFHLLSEGRLGLVVGDATGKGVPAALVMSTTCGMLQAVSKTLDASSPGEVLEQVNETLLARIPSNMFVTCFYAILDPKSGSLSYANAGHDLPYLWHGDGDAEELRARGMPLGLMSGMSYEEGEASLREEDGVLFYSDGLVEAHDPKGEMFGFPRLRTLVAKHGEERSLEDFLLEGLYSFVGEGWEQEDDITLLTLRRSATLS
jgi:serine phosphatase RsbU (regulator of sigma subunit)/predicted ester cyclase